MKEMTRYQRTRLMNIFAMAVDINETTKADVFVDLSPHVSNVSVRIFPNGWEDSDGTPDIQLDGYYNNKFGYNRVEKIHQELEALVHRLKTL